MVLAQRVHDDVRTGAAVVDVAQDVQLVDGQALDDVRDGHDEIVGTSSRDDSVHNDGHVGRLILVVRAFVQQFLDDVGKLLGQRLAHLAAGVLRRDVAADAHQLVDGDAIPVVKVFLLRLDEFQFLLWIIY